MCTKDGARTTIGYQKMNSQVAVGRGRWSAVIDWFGKDGADLWIGSGKPIQTFEGRHASGIEEVFEVKFSFHRSTVSRFEVRSAPSPP